MAENQVTRVIRVQGRPEGLDKLAAELRKVQDAQTGVAQASDAAATATERSARRQLSALNSWERHVARTDSAFKAQQQFDRELGVASRAFDQSIIGVQRYSQEIERLQRQLERAGSAAAKGSPALESMLGFLPSSSGAASASAAVFEAELARLDTIAQQRAAQIGAEFGRELSDRLVSSTGKSARDSASVFDAELSRLDDIARQRAAQTGQEFQRALNERLVGGSGKSAASSASVFQEMFAAQDEQARGLHKLRQQYDPLGVAQERYASAIEEADKLLQAGLATETQHVTITKNARKVLDDTTKAYHGAFVAQGKYTSGVGLARHELINLSRQFQDVGVSLASGQSFVTVLIQQGTQIADVFAASRASMAGFFAQAARGVAGFAASGAGLATGGALFGGAALLAGYQYAESQREVERSLSGVGRQSGVTIAQINRLAGAYADSARVSTSTAREMIAAFAGTGKIDAGIVFDTGRLSRDYAAQFDLGATDAAKQLAAAFVDPTRGAIELNKQIGFLDAKTLEYIRTAQAQGRVGEAQKALADSLGQSIGGAADRTSGLARAWNAVWNAASGAWDAIGNAVAGQTTAEERLLALIERRRNLEGSLRGRTATGRVDIGRLGDQIAYDQENIRRANQQADRDRRNATARAASVSVLAVLDEINPYGAELRRLETMASTIAKGMEKAGDALNPRQIREVAEAQERIDAAIKASLPPAERQREINALNVKAIEARTLAERTAVDVARMQQDAAFKLLGTEQQRLQIIGRINEAQAQANREAQDAARASTRRAELSGLRPYQRRLKEIELEERDMRERIGGRAGASAGVAGSRANGNFAARDMPVPGVTQVQDALALIMKHESGGRNIHQQIVPAGGGYNPSVGRVTGPSSAQGYFQITNSTWRDATKMAGIDRGLYPTAMSAPYDVQEKAAAALFQARGFAPWAPYNANLRKAIAAGGGPQAFGVTGAEERAILATSARNREALDKDTYQSIIGAANDNIEAQRRGLDATRNSFFMSTEEVARAQKQQELYTQAIQQGGVELATKLQPDIEKTAASYGELARETERVNQMNDALRTGNDLANGFARDLYSGLRNGKNGADSLRDALGRVGDKLMDLALNSMFSTKQGGGILGAIFRGVFGGSGAASWAPRMSGNGLELFGPGFASGGFTGHGGRSEIAGPVHRGEYVFDATATSRIGVSNLEAMRVGSRFVHQPARHQSPSVTISPVYQIDARGSQMTESQFRAILAENNAKLKAEMPEYLSSVEGRGSLAA